MAGPLGPGGSGSKGGITGWLVRGRICVTAFSWNVMVLPEGSDDISRITSTARVMAVLET